MDDFGVPLFQETPNCDQLWFIDVDKLLPLEGIYDRDPDETEIVASSPKSVWAHMMSGDSGLSIWVSSSLSSNVW